MSCCHTLYSKGYFLDGFPTEAYLLIGGEHASAILTIPVQPIPSSSPPLNTLYPSLSPDPTTRIENYLDTLEWQSCFIQAQFQVLAGPSADQLSPVNVNADKTDPFRINTDRFEGALTVRIKDFHGSDGRLSKIPKQIFRRVDSFKKPMLMIACGAIASIDPFVIDYLMVLSVALKAISYIDPSLEHDIYSDKPWAWSPLLATMNHVKTERLQSDDSPLPDWEGTRPTEDCSSVVGDLATITSKRDRHYSTLRLQIPIVKLSFRCEMRMSHPSIITQTIPLESADSPCLGFAFLMWFRLDKLWDGQPVRYECISRSTPATYFVSWVQIVELAGKPVSLSAGVARFPWGAVVHVKNNNRESIQDQGQLDKFLEHPHHSHQPPRAHHALSSCVTPEGFSDDPTLDGSLHKGQAGRIGIVGGSKDELLKGYRNAILTPNHMEFQRLLKACSIAPREKDDDEGLLALELSKTLGGCTILQKGSTDLIAREGSEVAKVTCQGSLNVVVVRGISSALAYRKFGRSMQSSDMLAYIAEAFEKHNLSGSRELCVSAGTSLHLSARVRTPLHSSTMRITLPP
ncbi:hypothetical protein KEM48_011266 [Puccinia striiformis f. sp. tritici PST-130]|nr:hypothetical protein KEM48_011266 [Puccinia striiformis f. sp. tritici PST-130]